MLNVCCRPVVGYRASWGEGGYLGADITNNTAEFKGVLRGLELALEPMAAYDEDDGLPELGPSVSEDVAREAVTNRAAGPGKSSLPAHFFYTPPARK